MNEILISWQDGNPEYLSDLDRQVMQKERLRRVRRTETEQGSRTKLFSVKISTKAF